jgi:hypothetical protein
VLGNLTASELEYAELVWVLIALVVPDVEETVGSGGASWPTWFSGRSGSASWPCTRSIWPQRCEGAATAVRSWAAESRSLLQTATAVEP